MTDTTTTGPRRYRLRRAEVEALLWAGNNTAEMDAFAGKGRFIPGAQNEPAILCNERGGRHLVYRGSFAVRDTTGHLSVVDGFSFERDYEEMPDPESETGMSTTGPTPTPQPCTHCCRTRLLGRDPGLWVCEHCGELTTWDKAAADPDMVTAVYGGQPHPKPLDPQGHICSELGPVASAVPADAAEPVNTEGRDPLYLAILDAVTDLRPVEAGLLDRVSRVAADAAWRALGPEIESLRGRLAEVAALTDRAAPRVLGDDAVAGMESEHMPMLGRLDTVLSVAGDLVETTPWCACPHGDVNETCPVHGPVGLLGALDTIATHTDGMAVYEIADHLHAWGVAAGVSRVELARAARRWGYACPTCHGTGEDPQRYAASPCPRCGGRPEYYEDRDAVAGESGSSETEAESETAA